MDRKDFLKTTALGLGALTLTEKVTAEINPTLDKIGFEHSPSTIYNQNMKIQENMIIHRADTRGGADHGWLKAKHTFSFANYYDPERMHFGVLRVLNDDRVAPARGFGTHPHNNMEIITIPLTGALQHKDSMGNTAIIKKGEVQIMSAGTGIQHSEMNPNQDQDVTLLQIWVLPKNQNIQPRYEQKLYEAKDRQNKFQTVVSPTDKSAVWINQDAFFNLANFDKNHKATYFVNMPAQNGLYIFVISGQLAIAGQTLDARDGMGVWDIKELEIEALSTTEFLIMELPIIV
jgi:quercetin 2,3-dioxygenase